MKASLLLSYLALGQTIQAFQQVPMTESRIPHEAVESLGHWPDCLLLAGHAACHLRDQRRLATQNALDDALCNVPQPFLWQMHQDWFQEYLKGCLEFINRQFVKYVTLQYAIHGSAFRCRLLFPLQAYRVGRSLSSAWITYG
jgi:hypothetical protein